MVRADYEQIIAHLHIDTSTGDMTLKLHNNSCSLDRLQLFQFSKFQNAFSFAEAFSDMDFFPPAGEVLLSPNATTDHDV